MEILIKHRLSEKLIEVCVFLLGNIKNGIDNRNNFYIIIVTIPIKKRLSI